jgi:hypothetical protein
MTGQKVWSEHERPGNSAYKLTAISLKNGANEITSSINISEDAWVEIEFEVIRAGARVILVLVLFDNTGSQLFASINNPEENTFYGVPLQPGCYRAACKINGNLLNDGQFYFGIIGLTDHWSERFFVDSALWFDALEDNVLRRDYQAGFSGPFRPKLAWQTTQL